MSAGDKIVFVLALIVGAAVATVLGCSTPCPEPEEFDFSLRSARYLGWLAPASEDDGIAGHRVDDGRVELEVDADMLSARLSFTSDGEPVVVDYEVTDIVEPY